MLVLSRKKDESIIIDQRITITILEVRGNQIRIGIEAPKDMPIVREEILGKAVPAVTAA
jgi:carbon storage regulator